MAKLMDITQLIRSKNAGPFTLTFDFMFDRFENYCRVRDSGTINRELFSRFTEHPLKMWRSTVWMRPEASR